MARTIDQISQAVENEVRVMPIVHRNTRQIAKRATELSAMLQTGAVCFRAGCERKAIVPNSIGTKNRTPKAPRAAAVTVACSIREACGNASGSKQISEEIGWPRLIDNIHSEAA